MKIMRLKDKRGNEMGKCICRLDKIEDGVNKKEIFMQFEARNIPKSSFFSS